VHYNFIYVETSVFSMKLTFTLILLLIGTLIYVVGGMQSPGSACMRSVECIDVKAGEYYEGIHDYPYRVTGLGCSPVLRLAGP